MKNLFIQYLISNSLNEGRPLAKFWRKRVSASSDAESFEKSARRLGQHLGSPQPEPPPATLHASIMREVREADTAGSQRERRTWSATLSPQLRLAGALALVLALGLLTWMRMDHQLLSPRPKTPLPSQAGKGPARSASLPVLWTWLGDVSSNGPALLTTPLSQQMTALSNDVREAAQFVLASLP